MREIKFRAWDKKSKKMREVDSIAFHNKRSAFDFESSNLPKVINLWGRDTIEQKDIILHRELDQCVILQYTGLKDKNGKEIYEGDVIRTTIAGDVYEDVVKWSDVDASWKFESTQGVCAVLWNDVEDGGPEVIGNIYENKEVSV